MNNDKRVTADYYLEFTTSNGDLLPERRVLENKIQELFAATLDEYLSNKGIETQEVHLILDNGGLGVEDVEQ